MASVTVTVDMQLRPEAFGPFVDQLPAMIEDTRSQSGLLSIDVLRHAQDAHRLFFIERWADLASYQAYMNWRVQRGDMTAYAEVMAERPKIDIWSGDA